MGKLLGFAAGLVLSMGLALQAADGWQTEVVDPSGSGRFSSMQIDKSGNVHLAYIVQDGNVYPLRYAFWDRKLRRWFVMPVDNSAGTCALTLDSKQRPHIAYVDYGTGSGSKLHHAYWDDAAKIWNKQPIRLASDIISYYTSIALDAKDQPTIAFYEYRGPKETDIKIRLRVVALNGKLWEAKTVDSEEGSGKFNSMAIDFKGRLHLAYANVSSGTAGLRYALGDATGWHPEIVDDARLNNGESVGYSTAVALDAAGNPHITYTNESTGQLKYAVHKNGRWQIEVVDRMAGFGYPDRNGIAIAEDGTPYISYFDAARGILKLAYRKDQKWFAEIVDSGGAGFTSSLQIYNGEIWVSYADDVNNAIKVSHRALNSAAKVSQDSAVKTPVRIP